MPIKFSDHAKLQLKRMRIFQKLSLEVARNPDEILSSYKRRRLRRKTVRGKILQIVTVTEGSKVTIVSGYYLRKQK